MLWTPQGLDPVVMRKLGPSRTSMDRSRSLLRQAMVDSGLSPGLYREPDTLDYTPLRAVHQRLCQRLEEEIKGFHISDLCKQLYHRYELILSHSALGLTASPLATRALRSLMELAVKSCDAPGKPVNPNDCDNLWALAFHTIEWDSIWDQFSSPSFSQNIEIHKDYSLVQIPHRRAIKARVQYEQYLFNRRRIDRMHLNNLDLPPIKEIGRESLKAMLVGDEFAELNECLVRDLGYGFVDYLLLIDALSSVPMASPVCETDYRTLVLGCSRVYGMQSSTTAALLRDFALSRESVVDISSEDIFSVRTRHRDSRLIRRPILLLDQDGRLTLLFGRESLLTASELFRDQVDFGRIPVDRWKSSDGVSHAFGEIQGVVGDRLRNAIAEECRRVVGQDHVSVEKGSISGVKSCPQIGGVDIFLVDKERQRFIAVEIKNSSVGMIEPVAMENEAREFLHDFLPTLRRKADWFRSNMRELKRECRIPIEEDYTMEEVIVVNQQRLWVLVHRSRLPILDDDEFLAKLGKGEVLLSDPVVE